MKKFKKIAICFLMLVLIVVLSGCAQIEYSRVVNTDGTIIDSVCVKLDEEQIASSGYALEQIEEIKTHIKSKMNGYINDFFTAFKLRDDGLLDIEKIAVKNNVISTVSENEGYIVASLKFKNYHAFKLFYGLHLLEDEEGDNEEAIAGFLYNKNVAVGKTIFATEDAKFVTNEFISYFDNNFSESDAELYYTFATPESKLHSNATKHYEVDGVYYHEWLVTSADQDIATFTYQIKPINWYVLALAMTFALIIVLFVVAFCTKNKTKNKNLIKANNQNAQNLDEISQIDEKT